MRGRALAWPLAAALVLVASVAVAAGALGTAGARAFQMAQSADDAAAAALEEGERALAQLRALGEGEREPDELAPLRAEAEAAGQALVSYRKLAQAASTEALQLLAEVTRQAPGKTPDPIRRETFEQRALLAAHEGAVMAARVRAEAERLRARVAEARLALAARAPSAPRAGPTLAAPAAPGDAMVLVPNLVGARLEAAVRDLDVAGLRLGGTTGARDGFVVKQAPEAGARVARQAAVAVTLSATAAGTTP